MSNGFAQNPNVDYPIYVSISNAFTGTSATLNTGTEDFLYARPSLEYLDWASPDIDIYVSGVSATALTGGFSVSARDAVLSSTAINVRLGSSMTATPAVGTVAATGNGGAQCFVSGNQMVAVVNSVEVPFTQATLVNVTSLPMTAQVGSATVGVIATGTSMTVSVGTVSVPQPVFVTVTGLPMTSSVGDEQVRFAQRFNVTGNFMTMQVGSVFVSLPGQVGAGVGDREGMMVSSNWMGS